MRACVPGGRAVVGKPQVLRDTFCSLTTQNQGRLEVIVPPITQITIETLIIVGNSL